MFFKISISLSLKIKEKLSCNIFFKSLDHFMMLLLVLITWDSILRDFLTFWTNPEIQDSRHSEMITQLLRHVTSSPRDEDVKGDIFIRTIFPPSLVVIAFIFSELRSGGIPPQS